MDEGRGDATRSPCLRAPGRSSTQAVGPVGVAIELRDYQVDALARFGRARERGITRQLGVAATGLGKTVIACALARELNVRTLIVAHRDELIEQAAAKVREIWPGVRVGIVKGESNDVTADVVVASVQTLARPSRLQRLLDYDNRLLGVHARFGLVVVDEAHHAAAKSYRSVIEGLGCFEPDGPLLLGLTATPDRGDGKGLDDLFQEVTFAYDLRWGIAREYLSDMRAIRVRLAANLGAIKVKRGDYDAAESGAMLEAADAPNVIVRAWLKHAVDRRTLVFTPTVALSAAVAAAFNEAGIPAASVDGAMSMEDRRAVLHAYKVGRLTVLANCQVLTEGYDEPRTDCIVMARPTKSRALFTQCVGRGTRRHPDKADCLVIDVVGASDVHDLVTVPSLFGIEKPERVYANDRPVTDVLREQVEEHAAAGALLAAEAELFDKARAGRMAWVRVHIVGAPPRFNLDLGKQGRVVMVELASGNWRTGWQEPDGTKRVLIDDVSMELAQGVGEDLARKVGATKLTSVDAAWRGKRVTSKQMATAAKLKIELPTPCTKGEASDLIGARIGQLKDRKQLVHTTKGE